ncbi:MAG: DegT/DnrJ/EryC1/StrS family aminotransferase [Candidatus Andersenbacteria bacterium]
MPRHENMSPILTALSPNTESDDRVRAWQILQRPWRWHDANQVASVEKKISALFNHLPAVTVSSGRRAMSYVLEAFDIGQGDEVIIQAFTCLAVPAAVMWTGAKPIYADIEETTFNFDVVDISRKLTPRTKAIIIQHTFGIPGPLATLQVLAAKNNIILIEDCAHALGATYNTAPVGTQSDAAILSFGRDKALSSVFGGAVVSRHPHIIARIRTIQTALPYPPAWWIIQQLLHPLFLAVIKPLYFSASIGKIILVILQRLSILSLAVTRSERVGAQPNHARWRYSPALAYLLAQQLDKLERFTAHRRKIAATYARALSYSPSFPPAAQPSWLRFPVVVTDRAAAVAAARAAHIMLGDWYQDVIMPTVEKSQINYHPGSCPRAESIATKIINLPTYPALTTNQAEWISKIVAPYVRH